MARLAGSLRYFRLPPDATVADLRQAYLHRVKQVHPDVAGKPSKEEFHELQQKFDEALKLLSAHEAALAAGRAFYDAPGRAGGFPVHGAHPGWHRYPSHAGPSRPAAPEIQVVGFPQSAVYPLTASLAVVAAAAGVAFSQHRRSSPGTSNAQTASSIQVRTPEAKRESHDDALPALALKQGPWNVPAAVAASKGSWSPSNAYKFIDSDSFYANRVKGHLREGIGQRRRLGDKQGKQIKDLGYEADHEPQVRDGVEMLPVHAAAQDGLVWWLERCGASITCRGMLKIDDACGDSPLHHAARHGVLSSCYALLRLGADPTATNGDGISAESLATNAGHSEVAAVLSAASLDLPPVHPDGLGVLVEPPDSIIFTGLNESQCLRRALNMAIGYNVVPPLPVSRGMHNDQVIDRIINVVRGSLQSTEFDLEELQLEGRSGSAIFQACSNRGEGPNLRGLLVYEAPGSVTHDAPGHWVAVRYHVADGAEHFFRLDPVRGPFRLTAHEVTALLTRYPAWRVLQGSAQLADERTARLAAASQEAQALMQSAKPRIADSATAAAAS